MGNESSDEGTQQAQQRVAGASTGSKAPLGDLLDGPLTVVNVGLEGFSEELQRSSVKVIQLDWRPPADGDAELARLLSKLGN